MRFHCLLAVLGLVELSLQRSTPADDHYVAAVVQYLVDWEAENPVNDVELIKEAADSNADIVVLPELTLTDRTTSIAVPIHGVLKEYPVPALRPDLYDDVIVAMSTAARQNNIYVVINSQEIMDCTQAWEGEYCPESKVFYFNTNVVFDRTGAVIDRYRKINLSNEPGRTAALKSDLGLFTTDFGVTFGHFICFDLMFQVPTVQVVQKNNIKDVIFPNVWFSEMPYLSATEIQEAYAFTMDINLLASGSTNIRAGSAGSGIYSGKTGALISIMPVQATTRLLVSRVPKVPGQVTGTKPGPIYYNTADYDNIRLIQDPSLVAHVTRPLVQGYQEFTLTDKDVSCTFRVRLGHRSNTQYRYRAAAFSGVRSFSGLDTGGSRNCAVFACTGDTKNTCGLRFQTYEADTTAIFEELTIISTVPAPFKVPELDADDSVVFPVSLTVSIMPLEPQDFTYSKTSKNNISAELYSFALWGRVYATDGNEAHPPVEDSSTVQVLGHGMFMSVFGLFLCNQFWNLL